MNQIINPNLAGFMNAGAQPVVAGGLSFLGGDAAQVVGINGTLTEYDFGNITIPHAPAADRLVVAMLAFRIVNGAGVSISGDFDDVLAYEAAEATVTSGTLNILCIAEIIPTGTTVNVKGNVTSNCLRAGCTLYSTLGASTNVPTSSDFAISGGATTLGATVTVPTDGAAVCGGGWAKDSGVVIGELSGDFTENSNGWSNLGSVHASHLGGFYNGAAGSKTVTHTLNPNTTAYGMSIMAVAWGP